MRAGPLIGIAVVVAGTACSRASVDALDTPERAGRDLGTMLVGRPADAIALDPARVTDKESVEVIEQIYEKLLYYDPDTMAIEPGLATSWDVSEGGRVWTFHLREGVRFHDGTPLNAAAVVFSFERQRDRTHPFHLVEGDQWKFEYWENSYRNIESVVAIDDSTVKITIERRYAPFAANLAMFPVAIVSPTAVERWGADYGRKPAGDDRGQGIEQRGAPVGTGPFRFAAWKGSRIVLERNPDYWGQQPYLDRLIFKAIPDARQRLIALESGAIDVAYSILPNELQFVQLHYSELALHRVAGNNVTYLAMNTTHPPFDDHRVRAAVNHAINKEPIVKLAFQGLAVSASSPLPPTQWGHHEPSVSYEYDPKRARALLEEARADGALDDEHELKFYVPSTPRPYLPDPTSVARVLETNLTEVGLDVKVVSQPFEEHLRDLRRGEHDLCLHGWVGDNGDPDNYLNVLFSGDNATPGFARNVAFFRDPELDGLLSIAQESDSREERESIYARAQELIARSAPWVPLAHSEVAIATRRDVSGLVIAPTTHVPYARVVKQSR